MYVDFYWKIAEVAGTGEEQKVQTLLVHNKEAG